MAGTAPLLDREAGTAPLLDREAGTAPLLDREADRGELGDRNRVDPLREKLADCGFTERQVFHRHRTAEKLFERRHRPIGVGALAQFGNDTVLADFVQLVEGDEHPFVLLGGKAEDGERADQEATIIDPDDASLEPERIERRGGRTQQLDFRDRPCLTDDVDVALHELAVAALLRLLGTPDRRDLDGAEYRRQLSAMCGVEPGERHGEIEAQAEVGESEGLGGCGKVVGREAALHYRVGELFVIAAEAGVEAVALFHDRCFDFVEAVRGVAVADDAQYPLAPGLVRRQEVAHAARRGHLGCHGMILAVCEGDFL